VLQTMESIKELGDAVWSLWLTKRKLLRTPLRVVHERSVLAGVNLRLHDFICIDSILPLRQLSASNMRYSNIKLLGSKVDCYFGSKIT